MQINFDSYRASIRKENKYLREALGSEEGHPRYQWAFSNDLMMPMIVLDEQSHIIYDYHCACGVNITVHTDERCNWTVRRARWEMRNLAFGMKDVWVMTKWKAPEVEQAVWEEHYGSVPYPQGGYFVPVSAKQHCLYIPGGSEPFRETSEMVVQAIRKHFKKTAKEHARDIADNWDKLDAQKQIEWLDRIKNVALVHEGFPGKKENWSAGGIGESPALAKES